MIVLENIGKRFRYDWIFKNINFAFQDNSSYAILGPNGSGKSTLMKILSGHLTPSVGSINFQVNDKKSNIDDIFRQISYAAPYIDLIEEFTLKEIIEFHARFKPITSGLKSKDLIDILALNKSADKEIRYFSSGMKQRVKLALAICCETPILLLDEPTTNLDAQGVKWYQDLISEFTINNTRTVIVASNIEHDYYFCDEQISITNFK